MNIVRIELADKSALARWGESVRVHTGDTGYLLHAAMRKAFGGHAPQPFVWLKERREILGYGLAGENELRAALNAACGCGDNAWLYRAFNLSTPCCKPFPARWTPGDVLRFRVLACPIRRFKSIREDRTVRTQEKDAFLLDCEQSRREGLPVPGREESYARWLTEQLTRDQAAVLRICRIQGIHMVRPVRRGKAGHDGAPFRLVGQRPEVLFSGELAVNSPEAFASLVARGIGRHRAFGYGMLLLQAA
jgi:CRISPR system Cascade subunit CasE